MRSLSLLLAVLLLLPVAAIAASGEKIDLLSGHRAGDVFALSLRLRTDTHTASHGSEGKTFREEVGFDYSAQVEVLEVDSRGRPIRERHDDVKLTAVRPEETGSLFEPGHSHELRWDRDGSLRLYVEGYRADRKVERIVSEILASRFENTVQPALFAPKGPVAVGQSWKLDPELARRFLAEQGIRVVEFEGTPRATLERDSAEQADGGLAIRFEAPIRWFELVDLPANAKASRSEGSFEGRIRLSPDGRRPVASSSALSFRMDGVRTTRPGMTRPVAWQLERSHRAEQSLAPAASSSLAASDR